MLLKNSITEDKTIWAGLNHPELPLEEADIAVFGIPYDGGVSFRSGTCEASCGKSPTPSRPPPRISGISPL